MLLSCVAIDDEPSELQLIKAYVERVPSLLLVQVFADTLSAIQFIRDNPVELVFLDIQIPNASGLGAVKSVSEKPMLIYTTEYKKFALEGFELEAVDCLVKPFNFDRFRKAVSKAEELYKFKASLNTKEDFLYVYSEYKQIKINLDDVEFIESLEDHIRIHLTEGKPILTRTALKNIIPRLPSHRFQRVHRSYVVAINKIKAFTNRKVTLDKAEVPVSESYIDVIRRLKKDAQK
jgi:two-component system, LytTR family, response regulator